MESDLRGLVLPGLDPVVPPSDQLSPARTAGVAGLVRDVLDQVGAPVDVWAVAATLESNGLRDVDAARYGASDVFGLAARVHAGCLQEIAVRPAAARALVRHDPLSRRLRRFAHFYIRGAAFALPMVVQTLSVLILGFALWSYLRFDNRSATVVSVGTIGSFLVTGGFVQAIGRLGRYYLEQQAFVLAQQVSWRLVRMGALATLAFGALGLWVSLEGGWLTRQLAGQAAAYYFLLSALWLVLAILYTLKRQLAIVSCIVGGIAVIAVVARWTPWSIYVAHWVGLALTVALSALLAWDGLRVKARTVGSAGRLARLPRRALLGYLVAPYFLYGTLYFTFLFLDRVVGWSEGDDPLFLWFDTPYEIGLDLALLSMVLTIAQLEYTIHEFSSSIVQVQSEYDGARTGAHNRYFRRFYLRQVALLAAISVVSVYLVLHLTVEYGSRYDVIAAVLDNPIMRNVYWFGAVGYALLVFALMNSVFFFSLSRVTFVLQGLLAAIVVSGVLGSVLSRRFEYWYSVMGLTAGALVFAVVTGWYARRVLRKLDYYYYSAF